MDIKLRAIVTQTYFQKYWQYHVRLFFICFFYFFSLVYAVVKQTNAVRKLALSVFPKDTMTLCPLRASNQQSYDH